MFGEMSEEKRKVVDEIEMRAMESGGHFGGMIRREAIIGVLDRVLLYLNYPADFDFKNWDRRLNGVVADLVSKIGNMAMHGSDNNQKVLSISSYGQSVTFSNETSKVLASIEDEELFMGVSKLLNRYRRPNVVVPRKSH